MDLMEVRCCCQPTKLLGYLPAPMGEASSREFAFAELARVWAPPAGYGLRPPSLGPPPRVRLSVHEFVSVSDDPPPDLPFDIARSNYMDWLLNRYRTTRAYKAEGMTLEQLQQIPGFLTAAPERKARP